MVVRSLVPGGVAHADGRLRPGDRLLAVNGVELHRNCGGTGGNRTCGTGGISTNGSGSRSGGELACALVAFRSAPCGVVRLELVRPVRFPSLDGVTLTNHNRIATQSTAVHLTPTHSHSLQHPDTIVYRGMLTH